MTRNEAISIFGSAAATARAIGITRSAVSQWPKELPPRIADRVFGAMYRAKKFSAKHDLKLTETKTSGIAGSGGE